MKTGTCEHCGRQTEPAVTNPRRFCLTCAPDRNAYGKLYRHYRHYRNGRNARGLPYSTKDWSGQHRGLREEP